jgi:hypothetical protein
MQRAVRKSSLLIDYYERIQSKYLSAQGDSIALLQEVLSVADEIGLDQVIAYLENCVIEKRTAWVTRNLGNCKNTKQPVWDGFRWCYEVYLGLSIPEDGQIVEQSPLRIVSHWWNSCLTLDACRKLGLDTRDICKKAYHRPVNAFLVQIHPDLRFERNYACIRPYAAYCEGIIYLEA